MSVFELCISWGEKFRESGKYDQALAIFELAMGTANGHADRSITLAHVGLTSWLMRRSSSVELTAELYRLAKRSFEFSLREARLSQNRARVIESQRHIAQALYDMGDDDEALWIGMDAWSCAKEVRRKDLVWFTHLIVLVHIRLYKSGELPKSVPTNWLRREIRDYLEIGVHDPNEVAKRAWRHGIFRSHYMMYGALLGPFHLLVHYLQIQRRLKLKRARSVPAHRLTPTT